jgi:hypothetical protein
MDTSHSLGGSGETEKCILFYSRNVGRKTMTQSKRWCSDLKAGKRKLQPSWAAQGFNCPFEGLT